MNPDDRQALADRLDRAAALNERTAKAMGSLGYGWVNAATELRAAAAALREDADDAERRAEHHDWIVDALQAERDAARAEVERLRAKIDMLRITLPRPDRLQAVRSVCRDDHPISLVLARVEAARALLDTEGGAG